MMSSQKSIQISQGKTEILFTLKKNKIEIRSRIVNFDQHPFYEQYHGRINYKQIQQFLKSEEEIIRFLGNESSIRSSSPDILILEFQTKKSEKIFSKSIQLEKKAFFSQPYSCEQLSKQINELKINMNSVMEKIHEDEKKKEKQINKIPILKEPQDILTNILQEMKKFKIDPINNENFVEKNSKSISDIELRLRLLEIEIESLQNKFLEMSNSFIQSNKNKITTKVSSLFPPSPLIDTTTPYFKQFKIYGKRIEYIGENKKWTQILIKRQIPKCQPYQFSCRIVHTWSSSIMIGILQRKKQVNARDSHNSGFSFCYYGFGFVYYSGKNGKTECQDQGKGFHKNDVVKVSVNLMKNQIEWSVDSAIRAKITSELLSNNYSDFYPFIQFSQKGDIVEICGE